MSEQTGSPATLGQSKDMEKLSEISRLREVHMWTLVWPPIRLAWKPL
jgi:hypothetical protein